MNHCAVREGKCFFLYGRTSDHSMWFPLFSARVRFYCDYPVEQVFYFLQTVTPDRGSSGEDIDCLTELDVWRNEFQCW